MKTQSFTIQATVEKPIVPGSDTNELDFTKSFDSTEYHIAESEHTGLKVEWFPFQERFNTSGLRIGGYVAGSYSRAFIDEHNYYLEQGVESIVNRFDAQYGIQMAMDIPFKKGGIAPYARTGIHYTIYGEVADWNEPEEHVDGNLDKSSIETKPIDFGDLFNPEVGVDVFVGRVGKARILVNAHAQWLDFAGYEGTNQLLIGGGVGIAFNAKGKK